MHPLRGTLALLAVLSLPVWAQTPADILERVAANYQSMDRSTYDFEIVETREFPSGTSVDRTRMVGDNGRYRQQSLPFGILYVSDGLSLFSYDPGRNEYTKSPGGPRMGQPPEFHRFEVYNLGRAARFLRREKLEIGTGTVDCDAFEVERGADQPPATYWIDTGRDLIMKVTFKYKLDGGLESVDTLALTKASIRQPVDQDLFRFQPPEGAVQVEKLTVGTKSAAEGKPAPDVALQDAEGKPLPLSKLRGGVVLLRFGNFSRDDLPILEWIHRALAGKGLTVINVVPNLRVLPQPDTGLYSVRQASDPEGAAAKALGIRSGTVLLDSDGRVLLADTSPDWERLARALQRLHIW